MARKYSILSGLMDKKGDVQFVQAGMLPESSLEELIKQLD